MIKIPPVKLIPEKVKGIDNVTEIIFYEDRVVFRTQTSDKILFYRKIAQYRRIHWWVWLRNKLGFPTYFGIVAYRDSYSYSYLFFNGKQKIDIKIPDSDRPKQSFLNTTFFKIQHIIRQGHYDTIDYS